MLHNTLFLFQP